MYSLFSALAHLLADNESWVVENMDAALDLDGPRVLLCVGSPGDNNWEDRMVDPRRPDFKDKLRRLFELVKARQQRIIPDIFGDVTPEAREFGLHKHIDQCVEVFEEFPEQILYIKLSNEGHGSDETEIRALTDYLKSKTSLLVSSVSSLDGYDVYAGRTARKITGDGGIWDHTEQPYDLHKESRRIRSDEEPIGFCSSVNSDPDITRDSDEGNTPIPELRHYVATVADAPLRHAAHAACAYVTGAGCYVLHTRAGVRGGGKADQRFGPWTRLTEQDGWADMVRMLAEVRNFFPPDLAGWSGISHSDPSREGSYPFRTAPLQPFDPSNWFMKTYANRSGKRYAGVVLKIEKDVPLEAPTNTTLETTDLRSSRQSASLKADQRHVLTERGVVCYKGEFA